ncbi:MAG: phage tail tube protein [Oligoflexus sp.]
MSDLIKKNTVVYVTEEVSEGTYVAPSAGAQAVQVLEDGFDLTGAKELVERPISTGGIGKAVGRPGMRTATVTCPVEFKAGSTEGSAPEWGSLLHSALGGKRTVASITASTSDGASGDEATIPLADADKNKLSLYDMIKIERTGEPDHLGWVTAVTNTDGSVSATIEPPLEYGDSFDAGDVISAVTTYYGADSGHPSLSITKEITGIVETAVGCKVSSVSLDSFTTGQIASLNFSLEGLNFTRAVASTGLTPAFDTSQSPLILKAKVFVDGEEVLLNEIGLSIENTFAPKTATGSENGRISSRITERVVSGSFNPYKQSDDVSLSQMFENNTKFDLFFYAFNPSGVNGKEECLGVYIKDLIATTFGEADNNGMLVNQIDFESDAAQIYISVI